MDERSLSKQQAQRENRCATRDCSGEERTLARAALSSFLAGTGCSNSPGRSGSLGRQRLLSHSRVLCFNLVGKD